MQRRFRASLVLLASVVFFTSGLARYAHELVAHRGLDGQACVASCDGDADHPLAAHPAAPEKPAPWRDRSVDTKCPMCLMFSSVRPAPTLATIAVALAQPRAEELFTTVERPVAREPAPHGRPRAPPAA